MYSIGFPIRNSLLKSLKDLAVGKTECLVTLQVPTGNSCFAALVSAYALTMNSAEEIKEQFYSGSIMSFYS